MTEQTDRRESQAENQGGSQTPVIAVYDCMVYLQTAFNGYGPAAACLEAAADGRVRLFASSAILGEVADVLGRPRVRRKRPHLTSVFVTALLERIRAVATVLDQVPERFSYARDPQDEPYLNLAVEVSADYLVSRDNDLLDLQDEVSAAGQQLRGLLPNLTILDPVAFLNLLPDIPFTAP